MKTLLLVRHAKTERNSATGADIDRKLTDRGLEDAPALGKALRKLNLSLDQVFCSSAVRARQTAELMLEKARFDGTVDYRPTIYLAEAKALIELLQVDASGKTVLLVGHNPGLEELSGILTSGRPHGIVLSTGAIVRIDFEMHDWGELGPSRGMLQWIMTPEMVHAL